MPAQTRRPGLDILRIAAVAAVAWFHYDFRMRITGEAGPDMLEVPGDLARYGYLGVSVFFAISGYVISLSTEGRLPFAFAVSRFARLWPIYVICMSLTAGVVLLAPGLPLTSGLAPFLANLTMVAPFLGQPFMDGAYWSIVVEILFYGWVALLMRVGVWRDGQVPVAVVWLGLSVANLAVLNMDALRMVLLTDHAGFFAFGMMLRANERGEFGARIGLVLAFGVAIASAVVFAGRLPVLYPGEVFDPVGVSVIVAVSLVLFAVFAHVPPTSLPVAALSVFGRATYPFYLLHQHIGYVAFFLFGATLGGPGTAALLLVVLVALSLFLTVVVERPAALVLRQVALQASERFLPARVRK